MAAPNLNGDLSHDQLLNLELLHHYSTKTYASLSDRNSIQELFQTTVVVEGLHHDFLIHCILSTSAFHLGYMQQQKHQSSLSQDSIESDPETASFLAKSRLYFLAAHAHYNIALSSFRSNLTSITPSNSSALFACSSLILIATLARPRRAAADDKWVDYNGDYGIAKTIEWLHLVRGTATLLEPTRPWVLQGSMKSLADWRPDPENQSLDEDTSSRLKELSLFVAESRDQIVRKSCDEAIDKQRNCFIWAKENNHSLTYTFSWPAMVSAEYMTLLNLKSPEALLILAHYCVLLYSVDDCWYVHGWAAYTVKAIYRSLEEPWRKWLEWPMRRIGLDSAACIAASDQNQIDYRPV